MALQLVDNDVLIKLAHWGLLDSIPAVAGSSWSNVATLASIRFRALRSDTKIFRNAKVAQDLSARLALSAAVPEPDPAAFMVLQGAVSIDAGEVELISAGCACQGAILVTGDKCALRALANPSLGSVASAMQGRILCLEQVLLGAANLYGAASVIAAVTPLRDLDTAIRSIIGPDGCSEDTFREGLNSYIAHLRGETGELLRNRPLAAPPN